MKKLRRIGGITTLRLLNGKVNCWCAGASVLQASDGGGADWYDVNTSKVEWDTSFERGIKLAKACWSRRCCRYWTL